MADWLNLAEDLAQEIQAAERLDRMVAVRYSELQEGEAEEALLRLVQPMWLARAEMLLFILSVVEEQLELQELFQHQEATEPMAIHLKEVREAEEVVVIQTLQGLMAVMADSLAVVVEVEAAEPTPEETEETEEMVRFGYLPGNLIKWQLRKNF